MTTCVIEAKRAGNYSRNRTSLATATLAVA
jgi:hypothetical protein